MVRPVAVSDLNNNHTNDYVNDFASSASFQNQDLVPQCIDDEDPEPPLKSIARMLKQTRQCKHFLKGSCRYGDKCGFSHSDTVKDRPNLTKTRLCSKFQKGFCDKGAACHFAHSKAELRQIETTSKPRFSKSLSASQAKPLECQFDGSTNNLPPEAQRMLPDQTQQRKVAFPAESFSQPALTNAVLLQHLISLNGNDNHQAKTRDSNAQVPTNVNCSMGPTPPSVFQQNTCNYQSKYSTAQQVVQIQSQHMISNAVPDGAEYGQQPLQQNLMHRQEKPPERLREHRKVGKNEPGPVIGQTSKMLAKPYFPGKFLQGPYQAEQPLHDEECVTPRTFPIQEQGSYSRSSTPPPEHVVWGYGMHPDLVAQSHRLDMLS
jgi:hypothetical protein